MKRWGTIALLALGMATPAQALSLSDLNGLLGDAASAIREAYNLPYRLVDTLARGVWGESYRQVYDYFKSAYSTIASGASTAISSSYSPLSLSVTNPLSQQLAKTLETATHNAVQGTEIINQGLGILEAAKQKIVQNAQMGFPAETPMAVQVCKLKIEKGQDTDPFPGISKTTDCIGGNTPPTQPAPKVTQGEIEEYINHYKATEAELTQKLANLAKKSRKSFRFILPPRGVLSPRSGDALG